MTQHTCTVLYREQFKKYAYVLPAPKSSSGQHVVRISARNDFVLQQNARLTALIT